MANLERAQSMECQVIAARNDVEMSLGTLPRLAYAVPTPPAPAVEQLMADVENLRAALATRDLIWSAKVAIAAVTGCGPEEAQRLLVQQSQHENRKLRDVAADIVHHSTRL